MDEKNNKDFIHETIEPEEKKTLISKKGLVQSVTGGAVFGATALLILGLGAGIWTQTSGGAKETVPETTQAESTESDIELNFDEAALADLVEKTVKKYTKDNQEACSEQQIMDALDTIRYTSVSIERESKKKGLFEDAYNTRDTLSGVIIGIRHSDYYILTNSSGLKKSDQYRVKFMDSQSVEAELVKKDSSLSLAILKVDGSLVPESAEIAKRAEDEKIEQGNAVLWYGSPSGTQDSFGYGYVSRIGSGISLSDGDFCGIQVTSTADWSDGSFLYNLNGELCGIAYDKDNLSESIHMEDGYGLALSMESLSLYVDAIMDGEKLASLGISGQGVNLTMQHDYGMPQGIYVTNVAEKSAAYKAGIQSGDVLTLLDGEHVPDMEAYEAALKKLTVGTEVSAVIYRSGKEGYHEMKITLKPGKR